MIDVNFDPPPIPTLPKPKAATANKEVFDV
jgi:hypothetical protein